MDIIFEFYTTFDTIRRVPRPSYAGAGEIEYNRPISIN